jgi:hypothetical protein
VSDGANLGDQDLGLVFISTIVPVQVTSTIYPERVPDADTSFVQGLYHSLLGREAEAAGLNGWVQALRSGAPREAVVGAILDSPEHRGILLDSYYATFLNRKADSVGKAAWVKAFLSGATEGDVVVGFLTSPEYQAMHESDDAFIHALYLDVLSRSAEAAGLANWQQVLHNGASRSLVAREFVNSLESHRRVVDSFYAAFLHRAGEAPGEPNWLTHLQAGMSRKSVAIGFLAGIEYFANARDHVA